jgi:hypothetical protein
LSARSKDDAAGSSGGQGITLTGDELKAFLAQAKAGSVGSLQPPPEAEDEPGTEKPKAVTVDDPEFSKYWKAPVAGAGWGSMPAPTACMSVVPQALRVGQVPCVQGWLVKFCAAVATQPKQPCAIARSLGGSWHLREA